MAENNGTCACGGAFQLPEDELSSGHDQPVCGNCGAIQETCIGCGAAASAWAVNGQICETCGRGCVDGGVNIHLTDSQQSRLLAWAEQNDLLPR